MTEDKTVKFIIIDVFTVGKERNPIDFPHSSGNLLFPVFKNLAFQLNMSKI